LRLPVRSKLVQSANGDVLVFTRAPEDSPKARTLRRAGVEVVRVPGRSRRPDLRWVLEELGRRRILSVLLEAGATLNSAALGAGVVDKIRIFFAPKVAGFSGGLATANFLDAAQDVRDTTLAWFGTDFSVEGYLSDVYGNR
jgi:diaminohydroxyphosphoribosylaminopyrimidine deaminase / 5-amino-6-(5-phosphoribosylamino)uracil reductase